MKRRTSKKIGRVERCKKLIQGMSTAHKVIGLIAFVVVSTVGVITWFSSSQASATDKIRVELKTEISAVKEDLKVAASKANYGLLLEYDKMSRRLGELRSERNRTRDPEQRRSIEHDIDFLEGEKKALENVIRGQEKR